MTAPVLDPDDLRGYAARADTLGGLALRAAMPTWMRREICGQLERALGQSDLLPLLEQAIQELKG